MLVLLWPLVSHTISTNEALVHMDACTSINSCLVLLGAPGSHSIDIDGFWCAKVPEWSRLMLVLLGAPFSHTIKALVRGDAPTSFGSCPVLMGHLVRKASATVGPW